MTAVLKKELRQMAVTMPAYLFGAFILMVVGLYFSYTNLNLASPQFEVVLQNIRFIFVIFVPLFTMRSVAEERRTRTDQLLGTLPLTDTRIVLGKYLAMVLCFALPVAVICFFPLILLRYGQVNLPASYLSILGFFLLGCASIAIGEFASALTETPVVAAVVSFALLLLCYLMDTVSRMVPGSAAGSLAAFLVTGTCIALLILLLSGRKAAGLAALILLDGIPAAVFLIRKPLLAGSFQKVLGIFYMNGRLEGFSEGLLDLPAIVYFASVSVIFLYLTVQVLTFRRQGKGLSLYCVLMTVLTAAACVLVNIMVLRLPAGISQSDFSSAKLYTLTDETAEWLHRLDREAVLYHICETGEEDDTVEKLLRRFGDESSLLRVEQVDPAVYPGFVSQYTDERVANNSIIAVCGEKSRVVDAADIYTWGMSRASGRTVATGFDGEGLIAGALSYVTSDILPVLYTLSANGERELTEDYLDSITRSNIEVRPLNLLTEEAVPEDCCALLMAAPSRDYSAEETGKILDYLEKGGHGILLTDFSMDPMPNLESILADYGLRRVPGIILEGDPARYMSYQYCVMPTVNYTGMTAKFYSGTYLLMPMAQGLEELDTIRGSIEMQPLLTTGPASYSKVDVQNMTTAEKEEGDISGPFTVGVLVQEDIDQDKIKDTSLAVFGTGYLLDDDYNQSVSGTNAQLIGRAAEELCRMEDEALNIPVRNLQPAQLVMSDRAANTWAVTCTFLLPALAAAAGVLVFVRRRKR